MLYAFGSDYWGCIGCNNELDEEVVTPYRVRFFDENPVEQVACGECHVVALTGRLPVSSGSWTKTTSSCRCISEIFLNVYQTQSCTERFHMTSRRPYWCPETIKRRPCWCTKPILWTLNSFLMQTLSFVPINFALLLGT